MADDQDVAVVHLLLQQANIRPPFGWNVSANRDRRPCIKAVVSVPDVAGGEPASTTTRDGGGTSDSGALFPLWNQSVPLTAAANSVVSVTVAEFWRDAGNQEQKRVCGTATFVLPRSHHLKTSTPGARRDKEPVYEGWVPLKNEHGGSEGKIFVALSTNAEDMELMKIGLAPGACFVGENTKLGCTHASLWSFARAPAFSSPYRSNHPTLRLDDIESVQLLTRRSFPSLGSDGDWALGPSQANPLPSNSREDSAALA